MQPVKEYRKHTFSQTRKLLMSFINTIIKCLSEIHKLRIKPNSEGALSLGLPAKTIQ